MIPFWILRIMLLIACNKYNFSYDVYCHLINLPGFTCLINYLFFSSKTSNFYKTLEWLVLGVHFSSCVLILYFCIILYTLFRNSMFSWKLKFFSEYFIFWKSRIVWNNYLNVPNWYIYRYICIYWYMYILIYVYIIYIDICVYI